MKSRQTQHVLIEHITVADRLRHAPDEAVKRLAGSMSEIGLRTPITVRVVMQGEEDDGADLYLVTGATRLRAAQDLGWSEIEAFVVEDCTEVDAQLWEIAENLHRAELTVLERDEQVALWVKLNAEKRAQPVQVSGGRGKQGGFSAVERDLGVGRMDASRAVKVAGLSDEAKEAAREVGLDDNRAALLSAAKEATPEAQVVSIRDRASARAAPLPKVAADPLSDAEANEQQVARLMTAWNAASPDAREEFLCRIDRPVMDKRFG